MQNKLPSAYANKDMAFAYAPPLQPVPPAAPPVSPQRPDAGKRLGSASGRGVPSNMRLDSASLTATTAGASAPRATSNNRLESAGSMIGGRTTQTSGFNMSSNSFYRPKDEMALTSSSWVHQSVSAFERDASNHWTKWGCGGKHLATELWSICQELQHVCSNEDGKWFPDMRMQRIHDQLLFIVHGLSKQPPHTFQDMATNPLGPLPSLTPRTPPAVVKAENGRLRRELNAAKSKVDSLEHMFASYVYTKDAVKARDSWLAKYALKGRYFAYDVTSCARAFVAWSKTHCMQKRSRLCAAVGAQTIEKVRENETAALAPITLSAWHQWHRLMMARKRVVMRCDYFFTQTRRSFLEYQVGMLFYFWVEEALVSRLEGNLADLGTRFEVEKQKWINEKRALMEKFSEAAMATLRRMIGADIVATMQNALLEWDAIVKEIKAERQRKLDEEERLRRLWEMQKAAAERMFGRNRVALMTVTFRALRDLMEAARQAKLKLEMGMSLAMRKLLGSEAALKAETYNVWRDTVYLEKRWREHLEMEAARKLLAQARERAINMLLRKSGAPDEEVLVMTFVAWADEFHKNKLDRFRKNAVIAQAMRHVQMIQQMLLDLTCGCWNMVTNEQKLRRKERLLIEQECRQKFLNLAQGTIMRLHRRLGVAAIFEGWYRRSKGIDL